MFVRITSGTGDASRDEEVRRWGNETLVPALQKMSGFRGYVGGFDRQSGRITAISYWDTEEQARGMRDAVDPNVLKQIAELGIQLGAAETYEVTVQV
jgi:hypothetical protein